MDYRSEAPAMIRDFLTYHETIQGHSRKTVDEYYLDLRNFFRFMKMEKNLAPRSDELDSVSIDDVDLNLVKSVSLTDVYAYMSYLSRDRATSANSRNKTFGLSASARARKIATIRSFYKYLTNKAKLLDENPVQELESPRAKKSLPRYLNIDESVQLLASISGDNQERDYCVFTLFLNCGIRISELVGLNINDINGDQIRVLGKGNKERMLYLNDACKQAISDWLVVREMSQTSGENALFITRKKTRFSTAGIHNMVKKRLAASGLDSSQFSSHKLRHTAATLMLQNGVDVRTLQEVLGHEHLNTTQIYTHVGNDDLRLAAQANPLANIKKK